LRHHFPVEECAWGDCLISEIGSQLHHPVTSDPVRNVLCTVFQDPAYPGEHSRRTESCGICFNKK
jgi:hypothetical protein